MNSAPAGIERRQGVTHSDMSDISEKLDNMQGQITGMEDAFVHCSRGIEARVEDRISEHSAVLELRDSIEELRKQVLKAVDNGDGRLNHHDEEIQSCIERIEALENTVKSILQEMTQITFLGQHTNLAVDKTNLAVDKLESTQSEGFIMIGRQISTLGDSFNIAMTVATNKSKLPMKVWFGVGAGAMVVIVGLVAVVTGNTELLNTLKGIF